LDKKEGNENNVVKLYHDNSIIKLVFDQWILENTIDY